MPNVLETRETSPAARAEARPGGIAGLAKGALIGLVVLVLSGTVATALVVPISPYVLLVGGLVAAVVVGGRDATTAHRVGIVVGYLGAIAVTIAVLVATFDDFMSS